MWINGTVIDKTSDGRGGLVLSVLLVSDDAQKDVVSIPVSAQQLIDSPDYVEQQIASALHERNKAQAVAPLLEGIEVGAVYALNLDAPHEVTSKTHVVDDAAVGKLVAEAAAMAVAAQEIDG